MFVVGGTPACDRELRIPAAATSAIPNFDTIRSGGFVLGFSTRPPYPRRMTFDRITVDPDLMGGSIGWPFRTSRGPDACCTA